MVYSTIQDPPPHPSHTTVCIFCTFSLRMGGGGQREVTGTVDFLRTCGQQFTSWIENINHE
jgi:hypothetical protein